MCVEFSYKVVFLRVYLRAGWATLRGVEFAVPTKEEGRGRLLRGVVGVDVGVPPPPAGLLSIGIPLLFPPLLLLLFRDWRLVEVGIEAEPLMVGLT